MGDEERKEVAGVVRDEVLAVLIHRSLAAAMAEQYERWAAEVLFGGCRRKWDSTYKPHGDDSGPQGFFPLPKNIA